MSPLDKTLLEKFMTGKCSPEEEAMVYRWLDINDSADYPGVHKESKYDQKAKTGWHNLVRIFAELNVLSAKRRFILKPLQWAVAAAILVALSMAVYFNRDQAIKYGKKYQTDYGEIKRISLEDGTTVTLNSRSTLLVLKGFNVKNRQVLLEGEAYFRIKHGAKLPFKVRVGKLSVTALGTAFDVSAFKDDPESRVSLKEGKVLVKTASGYASKARDVILSPGQEVTYQKKTHALDVSEFNSKEISSWQGQVIYFHNADIGNVLNKLERFYGVSIDSQLKPRRWELTGEYRNETLQDVLESLSFNYNIKYIIKGNKVVLYEP